MIDPQPPFYVVTHGRSFVRYTHFLITTQHLEHAWRTTDPKEAETVMFTLQKQGTKKRMGIQQIAIEQVL